MRASRPVAPIRRHSRGMCSMTCPSYGGCECSGFIEDSDGDERLSRLHHRYNTSAKGRLRGRMYGTSLAARDRHRRYNRSEKGLARSRAYAQKGQE